MKTSDEGVIALIGHEGIILGPYLDSAKPPVWTWGVGHTAAAGSPDPAAMPRGVPTDQDAALRRVFEVFRADLAKFEAEVSAAITVPVVQHEFDSAVSFHYNTGAIARATWVRSLNAGDRAKAAEQIMNWKKPASIIERRAAEQRLFRDGVYPESKINVWQVTDAGKVIWTPARVLAPDEALSLLRGPAPADLPPWGGAEPVPELTAADPDPSFFTALLRKILSILKGA